MMSVSIKNVVFLFSILFFQNIIFAQTNNFTGTWVLNFEKSKLEDVPKGLTSNIFMINQQGEKMQLTIYHLFGKKKKKLSFKMVADGKTRRTKVLFKGKLEKEENGLVATLWRNHFLNIVHYRFGNTKQEFIADEVYTGNPKNHHNIWVFDKK